MRKFFINALAFCAMSALVFTSCSNDDDPKDPSENENVLSGAIESVVTLDATKEYTLSGTVTVEDGGELVIPAGTVIKCKKGFSNYLIVLQGGKINAKGTAEKPITFTAAENNATSGYWGGIIINGKAPISGAEAGSTGTTEVNNAYAYGGTETSDNSGILEYVKIEYAGARSSADVEHNGLTLNGVGNGTSIKNIYILESADDAIEFFGGSVNVEGLLAVNPDDDMFDFTQGYTGTLSSCYGVWADGYSSTEEDPRGIEADGNLDGKGSNHIGQSNFKVNNMTIDLRLAFEEGNAAKNMKNVLKIRRGATAEITNALLKGNKAYSNLIDLTDGSGNATDNCKISITNTTGGDETIKNNDVNISNITVNPETANTGCDATIFGWTGYDI